MGHLTGAGAHSGLGAALSLFKPAALAVLLVANLFWAAAFYYGLKETKDALPMLIAIGVITSFVYSVAFLGDEVTALHLLGLVLVLGGIYLLV